MRRVVEVVMWWAGAFGVWLISLSAVSGQELAVAAGCALPCGLAAAITRWSIGGAWSLRLRWLRPLVLLPVAIVTDAVQVLVAPLRPRRGGTFKEVRGMGGERSRFAGREAIDTIQLSATPGTYVIDADPDNGRLLVHSLAGRGPRMEDRVAR